MTQPVTQVEPAGVEPPLVGPATQVSITILVVAVLLAMAIVDRRESGDSVAGDQVVRDRGVYRAAVTIDINAAEPRELALLPGIGPVLADRIAANRDRLGRFRTIAELDRVHGVGPRTIDQIDPFAVVIERRRRVASVKVDSGREQAHDR